MKGLMRSRNRTVMSSLDHAMIHTRLVNRQAKYLLPLILAVC